MVRVGPKFGINYQFTMDGLLVQSTQVGSPAEEADILAGDIVLRINGFQPRSEAEIAELAPAGWGRPHELVVLRPDGSERVVHLEKRAYAVPTATSFLLISLRLLEHLSESEPHRMEVLRDGERWLTGRILLDGRPVPGVPVAILQGRMRSRTEFAETDHDGRYTVRGASSTVEGYWVLPRGLAAESLLLSNDAWMHVRLPNDADKPAELPAINLLSPMRIVAPKPRQLLSTSRVAFKWKKVHGAAYYELTVLRRGDEPVPPKDKWKKLYEGDSSKYCCFDAAQDAFARRHTFFDWRVTAYSRDGTAIAGTKEETGVFVFKRSSPTPVRLPSLDQPAPSARERLPPPRPKRSPPARQEEPPLFRPWVPPTGEPSPPDPMLLSPAETGRLLPSGRDREHRLTHSTRRDFLRGVWAGAGTRIVGSRDGRVVLSRAAGSVRDIIPVGRLPVALSGHASVTHNGRLYVLGGLQREVFSAAIRAGGRLGRWRREAPFPRALRWMGLIVWDERIFALGGEGEDYKLSREILSVPIESEGRLGNWTSAGSLPMASARHAVDVSRGEVSVVGGWYVLNADPLLLSLSYYVSVNSIQPEGTIGRVRAGMSSYAHWKRAHTAAGGPRWWGREHGALAGSFFIGGADGMEPLSQISHTLGRGTGPRSRLPVGLWQHSAGQWSGKVFVAGGLTTMNPVSVSTAIYSFPLPANDGLGTFEWVESVSTENVAWGRPCHDFGAHNPAWEDGLYLVGGKCETDSPSRDIFLVRFTESQYLVPRGWYCNGFNLRTDALHARFKWRGAGEERTIRMLLRTASLGQGFDDWRGIGPVERLDHVAHVEYCAELIQRNLQSPELLETSLEVIEYAE